MTSPALHTTLSLTEDAGNPPRNKESNSKGAIHMNLSGRKRRTIPWQSVLLLIAFTCLIVACGSTSSTGSTGGQTEGGSTATPVSTRASTPTPDPPGSTATPGSISNFPGCGGQASLLSIRMLDQLHTPDQAYCDERCSVPSTRFWRREKIYLKGARARGTCGKCIESI